jgi:ATP-dependent Clp protease ATP-binding subunit ClpB
VKSEVMGTLREWCTGELDKGGRGIGMALESHFVNPLARALFELDLPAGTRITVRGVKREGSIVELDLQAAPPEAGEPPAGTPSPDEET